MAQWHLTMQKLCTSLPSQHQGSNDKQNQVYT